MGRESKKYGVCTAFVVRTFGSTLPLSGAVLAASWLMLMHPGWSSAAESTPPAMSPALQRATSASKPAPKTIVVPATGHVDAMRGPTPLDESSRPPPLGNNENKDVRRNRAFPSQPPTIPGGFVAGIMFWGGFNTALELTNTETFCTGCHEMHDNVYQELKTTIHYTNRSGVRAKCPDCHVPHNWTDKMGRKMQASKEVWGKIFGTISTREKFEGKRLELAQHEWGKAEGQRFPRMPQLPWFRLHGLHTAKPAGGTAALDVPCRGREDVHRLPQGDLASPAQGHGHDPVAYASARALA